MFGESTDTMTDRRFLDPAPREPDIADSTGLWAHRKCPRAFAYRVFGAIGWVDLMRSVEVEAVTVRLSELIADGRVEIDDDDRRLSTYFVDNDDYPRKSHGIRNWRCRFGVP
ncbi:hypothetical protein BH09ACT8_BH09ACT8_35090 [soil metagenome]